MRDLETISDCGPMDWHAAHELGQFIPELDSREQAVKILAAAKELDGTVLSVHGYDIEYDAEHQGWVVMFPESL
ncbi:MAG: hypothetical protein FWE35_10950 [Streptosporangiales bacterium]|nr:hypothetical protein [Streptosporangiales bacterium]